MCLAPRFAERPLPEPPGAEEINQRAGDGDCGGDGKPPERVGAVDQQKAESGHGDERRQRIERNPEGPRQIGLRMRSQHYADCCRKNCSRMRVITSIVMTCASEKKQKKAPTTPSATSERWGMPCFGCTAARKRK